jgi:hypothetical protein
MAAHSAYHQPAYPVVQSSLHIGGPQQEENLKKWQPILDKYAAALVEVSSEGKGSALDRHTSRGQLLGWLNLSSHAALLLIRNSKHEIG